MNNSFQCLSRSLLCCCVSVSLLIVLVVIDNSASARHRRAGPGCRRLCRGSTCYCCQVLAALDSTRLIYERFHVLQNQTFSPTTSSLLLTRVSSKQVREHTQSRPSRPSAQVAHDGELDTTVSDTANRSHRAHVHTHPLKLQRTNASWVCVSMSIGFTRKSDEVTESDWFNDAVKRSESEGHRRTAHARPEAPQSSIPSCSNTHAR